MTQNEIIERVEVLSWNKNFQNIIVYLIQIVTSTSTWTIEKRYSEFRALYREYRSYVDILPTLKFPPKKFYHTNEILNCRLRELNTFIQSIQYSKFPEINCFLQVVEHTGIPVECCHLGVHYIDKKLGSGLPASKGDIVRVHYIGRLESTGEIFDRSKKKQGPFEFKLGEKEVIPGWDIGIAGMRMAGSRSLIIPPDKAYGKRGIPPDIPPYATLLFEIHVVEILRESVSKRY